MSDFIEIDPKVVSQQDIYKLMIGAIVPRPIAFVSTAGKDGSYNLAPFSFFNGVSSNPPCIMFSCGITKPDEKKDTLRNIEETEEFVINSANEWLIEPLVKSAAEYPYGVNEMERVGLTPLFSKLVKPHRVKESAVQLECKLHQFVKVGDGSPGSAVMVIGEIILAHISPTVYENGRIKFDEYQAIGRLGGFSYGKVGEVFDLPVPKVNQGE